MFHFDQLNLPKDLMKRHVIDPVKLPNYYFRDDGLQLWKIIEKMTRTVLTLHYWKDTNVERDEELQSLDLGSTQQRHSNAGQHRPWVFQLHLRS